MLKAQYVEDTLRLGEIIIDAREKKE